MNSKRIARFAAILMMATGATVGTGLAQLIPGPAPSPTVIKTETKLVLVDVVVANKKGQYVDDLAMKNFRVWEDNKEQALKTFSYGPDPSSPDAGKRYMVLFFDSNNLTPTELIQTRLAAQKFIESNAGPDRLIAVASFMGNLQVIQNFSGDIDKLKAALPKVRSTSMVRGPDVAMFGGAGGNPNGMGRVDQAEEFASRAMLQGLRGLARNLAEIPGKSLILFTSGFPLSNATRDEATVTISVCNRSNVAIYPVDARGISGNLTGPTPRGRASLEMPGRNRMDGIALAAWPVQRIASMLMAPQVGAGRGGATGGATSPAGGAGSSPAGSSGGGAGAGAGVGNPAAGGAGAGRTTTAPGNNPAINNPNNPNNNPNGRGGDPFGNNNPNDPFGNNNPNNRNGRGGPFGMEMNPSALDRQQILYMLADGTGGFVILNTNDLAGGLEKIAKEQTSYYIVGYTPVEAPEGSCHTLKVKVDRGGTNVRARAGYCNAKSKDVLAGNPIEKTLESRVAGTAKGSIAASMSAPHFYTGANTARISVTLEIPTDGVKFEKVKGRQHAAINVLGIAYSQEGTVAARFSDVVKFDFETSKEVDKFKQSPMHYENQFDIASGSYGLKVVVDSGGENFGKLELPLTINAYDPTKFSISGIALCKSFGPVSAVETSIDSLLTEGRASLVAGNFKFIPTGYTTFKKSDNVSMYFEIYEPLLAAEGAAPKVSIQMRFLDAKTGGAVTETGSLAVDTFAKAGSPIVSTGLKLPVATLAPGSYKLEIKAIDSAGAWAVRSADFEVIP